MKRAILVVLTGFVLSAAAFAISGGYETTDTESAVTLVNGAGWNSFKAYEKELYVRGIMDTIGSCSTIGVVFEGTQMDQDTLSFVESLSRLIPPDMASGDVVKELDKFYKDKENIRIPIVSAYFMVLVTASQWADETQLAEALQKLKDHYNGKPKSDKAGTVTAGTAAAPSTKAQERGKHPDAQSN